MNVLFVCTANIQRSKTAESVFKQLIKGVSKIRISSAGTDAMIDAGGVQLTKEMIESADRIFVMEDFHEKYIVDLVLDSQDKIVNLDVPDVYYRDDPYLILQLREKLEPYARELKKRK